MSFKIFYAWQSDRPNNLCRGLIRRALEDAVKELEAATDIQDAERDGIEIDSDTLNIPGSPPVAETIFEKIRESNVFVADLTPIDLIVPEDDDAGHRRQPPPNPNVMLEYGYALVRRQDEWDVGGGYLERFLTCLNLRGFPWVGDEPSLRKSAKAMCSSRT